MSDGVGLFLHVCDVLIYFRLCFSFFVFIIIVSFLFRFFSICFVFFFLSCFFFFGMFWSCSAFLERSWIFSFHVFIFHFFDYLHGLFSKS